MIHALDQFPCSPRALGVRLTASPKGFRRFSGNSSHRRVEPYRFRGSAAREGNDERPSPLTVLNGYCDCTQLLGLALRHAMDDVRRKSVPDIVGNRVIRRPGISLRYCGRQNFVLLDLLRPRFWCVQWQHRFSIVSRCSALFQGIQQIEQVFDIHGANGFVRRHSYFPSD
jgi:hypothetical protein